MSAIIYLLTNTVNGKQYVGQTSVGLEKRWYEHCYESNNGSTRHLCRALRKYGPDAFTREILEHTTVEDVNARETFWIAELKTKERGYNMTEGGEGTRGLEKSKKWREKISLSLKGENHHYYGKKLSIEHRNKISASLTGKTPSIQTRTRLSVSKTGEKNPFYRKKFSKEHRAKLSESAKGKTRSPETRAKMSAAKKGKTFSAESITKRTATRKLRERMKRIQAPPVTIQHS